MGRPRTFVTAAFVAVALAACSDVPSEPLDPAEVDVFSPAATTAAPEAAPTGAVASEDESPAPPASAVEARVVKVTDGDTIVLAGIEVGSVDRATGGRRARLVGVDTPEVFGGAECYGAEASAFTKRELDARQVLVDFDVERTDRFGRALVYVWQVEDGLAFFNGRLVAEGYALQLTIPPNVRYAELFTRLVRRAREADVGLWSGCPARGPGGTGEAQAVSSVAPIPSSGGECHASYPDFCIPPPPPDLDCDDIPQKRFTVRHDVPDPDPHGFDGRDDDGVGCES